MSRRFDSAERLLLLGISLGLIWLVGAREADPAADAVKDESLAAQPTIVLVVLDTVRADHITPCGASEHETPTLMGLVSDGAELGCDVIAPGSWTLPSHASFFTGEPIESHGAHFVPRDDANLLGLMQVRALDSKSTLASALRDRGYQTVALSGNPVISDGTGLVTGFDWWRSARFFGRLYGDDYIEALSQVLQQRSAVDKPLFLFLNIADAHQPWSAIPDGEEGLSPQPAMHPRMEAVFQQRLDESELEEHFRKTRQAYAYGVRRADRTLGRALELLRSGGWTSDGLRLVVVSDHGEFLGEHGLVDHGRYLWDANQEVFLINAWLGSGPKKLEPIPPRLGGRWVFHLTRDGVLPRVTAPTTAVAFPDTYWQKLSAGRLGTSMSAAIWTEDAKFLWQDGEVTEFASGDVDQMGTRATSTAPLDQLEQLVTTAEESGQAPTHYDPELLEQLRAAGYME